MYDFHMHSTFSADCEVPMEEMVQAGIKQQLKKICFTEHIDYEYPDPSITFDVDLDQYENEIKKMNERFGSQIQVLRGIELGVQPHILEQYRQLLRERSFDFIICSMHSTDGKDLHSGKLFEGLKLDEAYEKYYGELYDCVKNFEGFNILGHLDLVTRYKYEEGVYHFLDIIEEIFKTIIRGDKELKSIHLATNIIWDDFFQVKISFNFIMIWAERSLRLDQMLINQNA